MPWPVDDSDIWNSTQQMVLAVDKSKYDSRWGAMWEQSKRPFFDQGKAAPALTHLLQSGSVSVQNKRVIVPGCGTGYDALAFAQAGAAAAVGLDLVTTAVDEATAHLCTSSLPAEVKSRVEFVQGDFFTYEHPGGAFDLGYDYTFLCALHPAMRTTWAQHWARLIKPGGELVALMFPVDPRQDLAQGPPFAVTPMLYKSLLEPLGFRLTLCEAVPPERSGAARAGREIISHWTRS